MGIKNDMVFHKTEFIVFGILKLYLSYLFLFHEMIVATERLFVLGFYLAK